MIASYFKENSMSRLRELRAKLGISQQGLADYLGCSVASIHRWESGKTQPKISLAQYSLLASLIDEAGLSRGAIAELAQELGGADIGAK